MSCLPGGILWLCYFVRVRSMHLMESELYEIARHGGAFRPSARVWVVCIASAFSGT